MSSGGFSELIEVRGTEPAALLAYASAMAVFVAGALAVVELSARVRAAMLACALGGIVWSLRGQLGGANRLTRAVLQPDGHWRLFFGPRGPLPGRLVRSWGRSGGPIIALEWRGPEGERIRAWLCRAGTPETQWRRLRVRLRLA